MIQLKIKSEFSLRKAYGHIKKVVEACEGNAVALTDNGTWGYVKFYKACKAANKKPIFGLTLDLVPDSSKIRYNAPEITILAKNLTGLREIYTLASLSWERKYYTNRIYYADIHNLCDENVSVIIGQGCDIEKLKNCSTDLFIGITPNSSQLWIKQASEYPISKVITSDNCYTKADDDDVYEVFVSDYKKTNAKFILNECEMKAHLEYWEQSWFDITHEMASEVEEFELPVAENVKFKSDETIEDLCRIGIKDRKLDWTDEYEARLQRELVMIKEKAFEDYFFVIADLVKFAKTKMLVGPARGSSAGSLVCYLTGIVDIDPIRHGLIFERFIDINRADLPDVDIDFPDTKRKTVINYLERKYGKNCIAHIGTISVYKPKSALGELGKKAMIPFLEMKDLKDTILERSGGDARAAMCIEDTFNTTDLGKEMVKKYPSLRLAQKIEGHARHSGKHAAGIIVLNDDIRNYCSLFEGSVAQIDKKDAESLNILKIDALGLRTLSVIEDCLNQINMNREKLLQISLDDERTFEIFRSGKFSGIFQFEGYALQSLSKQMAVETFEDIVAITTLARPGPLHSGGANIYIERRTGKEPITYLHDLAMESTKDSYGIIIYQEQVMNIGRAIGNLSWEEVSDLRKAMSKSLGEEFFNKFWIKFKKGAAKNGIESKQAKEIWENMCTFGSYAFNRSHAVSYGLISYWCGWLKAHYPLEFAVACLKNSGGEDPTVKILRELVNEGFEYKPFDLVHSKSNWSIQKGVLIGGLLGIKGIGPKMADDIIKRQRNNEALTAGQQKKLDNPDIYYEDVFECETRYGEYYKTPEKFNIHSGIPVSYIKNLNGDGEYIFIGKLLEKNLRDLNEYGNLVKRDGKIIKEKNLFLNLVMEDDTDKIICTINRWIYPKHGKSIIETGKIGDYYLVLGHMIKDWRKIYIDNIRKLN